MNGLVVYLLLAFVTVFKLKVSERLHYERRRLFKNTFTNALKTTNFSDALVHKIA